MSSTAMFIAEITLTLGVALGFGFYQLWDLKKAKARTAAKAAAAKNEARGGQSLSGS